MFTEPRAHRIHAVRRQRETGHVEIRRRKTQLPAKLIAALHAAVDHDTVVTGTRARVDGSATVAVSLPLASLAAVTTGTRGLPWSA